MWHFLFVYVITQIVKAFFICLYIVKTFYIYLYIFIHNIFICLYIVITFLFVFMITNVERTNKHSHNMLFKSRSEAAKRLKSDSDSLSTFFFLFRVSLFVLFFIRYFIRLLPSANYGGSESLIACNVHTTCLLTKKILFFLLYWMKKVFYLKLIYFQ